MTEDSSSMQSKGGKARALSLTKEQRKTIARNAAATRWSILRATHEGEIKIGDAIIPCAVLEDGTRVLSQSGFLRALGRSERPSGATFDEDLRIVTADNLKPFITKDLTASMKPIDYIPIKGGKALGFRADLLRKVCEVYLQARAAGVLHHTQYSLAKAAEIIIIGLSDVGTVALVDEATGYQYDRERNALAKILEEFIADEIQRWSSTFPLEFYKHIYRLHGWPFDPDNMKRPQVIGHYTNDIVYKRLAPGVLDELRKRNPRVDGKRKHKFFQWLTGEIGHPKLLAHLEGVKILMRESNSWEEFKERMNKHYPIIETTDLGFEVETSPAKT